MKYFFRTASTVLMLLLFNSAPLLWGGDGEGLHSQPSLDSCKRNFLLIFSLYTAEKDSLAIYKEGITKLRAADSHSQMQITQLTLAKKESDTQLELFKQREAEAVIEPLIEWQGFYINFVPYYRIDSAIMTETFISHFRYALSVDANISIMQKFRLAGELEFNFSDKPVIKLKAGWRVF